MKTYTSNSKVQAVQVKTIEGLMVNDDKGKGIRLGNRLATEYTVRVGDWLVVRASGEMSSMTDAAFQAHYGKPEKLDKPEKLSTPPE